MDKGHALTNFDPTTQTADCPTHGPGTRYNSRGQCVPRKKELRKYAYRGRNGNVFHLSRDEMVELKTGKVCEICGSDEDLRIDHCHETGKFRGILCHQCNLNLGRVGDSIEMLKRMIAYLRAHTR